MAGKVLIGNEQPEMVKWPFGTKQWILNGKFHRTDGPAIEFSDGAKEWWLNGELHRTDGPAIVRSDGYKEWHVNGRLHRLGGPAVEWRDGYKQWWLDGQRYDEKDYYIQRDIMAGLNDLAQFKAKQDK